MQLWYYGDLIVEHRAKLGRSGLICDEDPAVRAKQLVGDYVFKREYVKSFVESRIERLFAFAELEALLSIKEYMENGDYSQEFFMDIETAHKFKTADEFALQIDDAIKNKSLDQQ